MKLWLLRPREDLTDDPWNPWYDKAFGFVVRAETQREARELANLEGGQETGPIQEKVYRTGGDPWLHPEYSTCEELLPAGDSEVIIRDFAAA